MWNGEIDESEPMRQQRIMDGSFGREGYRTLPWQGLDYTGVKSNLQRASRVRQRLSIVFIRVPRKPPSREGTRHSVEREIFGERGQVKEGKNQTLPAIIGVE